MRICANGPVHRRRSSAADRGLNMYLFVMSPAYGKQTHKRSNCFADPPIAVVECRTCSPWVMSRPQARLRCAASDVIIASAAGGRVSRRPGAGAWSNDNYYYYYYYCSAVGLAVVLFINLLFSRARIKRKKN